MIALELRSAKGWELEAGMYLEIVVIWVLQDSAEEEGPGQVVNCVLLVLNCAAANFRHKMIVQGVVQVALYWEGFKEELFVVFFAG